MGKYGIAVAFAKIPLTFHEWAKYFPLVPEKRTFSESSHLSPPAKISPSNNSFKDS